MRTITIYVSYGIILDEINEKEEVGEGSLNADKVHDTLEGGKTNVQELAWKRKKKRNDGCRVARFWVKRNLRFQKMLRP